MFKVLWDLILANSFHPSQDCHRFSTKQIQFESFSSIEKLELVWYSLVQISQTYSFCPQLLCQREYLTDLSRILTVILLVAPTKQKFVTILSCVVISPICSELLTEIINKKWIPLENILDGFVSIMRGTAQRGIHDPSPGTLDISTEGFKITRSPSLMTEFTAEIQTTPEADLTAGAMVWNQILPPSNDEIANKSSSGSLKSTLATMLLSLIPQLNREQFISIRSKFSRNQLFPRLCLDFTKKQRLDDLLEYLNSLLDDTVLSLSGFSLYESKGGSGASVSAGSGQLPLVSRLDEHWFFSRLSLEEASVLLGEIFVTLEHTLDSCSNPKDEGEGEHSNCNPHRQTLTMIIRLISALLTSTPNIHKLPCPPLLAFQSSPVSATSPASPTFFVSRNWIEMQIEAVLESVRNLSARGERHGSSSSHLIRLVTTLVFVFIISARRHHPSNTAPSIAASAGAGAHSLDHSPLLTQLAQLLQQSVSPSSSSASKKQQREAQEDAQDKEIFCLYLKCCLSLDRIGFLRDSCAKEICLDRFIDFFPQNCYLYLFHVVNSFHQQQLQQQTQTQEHEEDREGEGRVRMSPFIERDHKRLLHTVCPSSPHAIPLPLISPHLSFPLSSDLFFLCPCLLSAVIVPLSVFSSFYLSSHRIPWRLPLYL
jgi:hypothetical protein